uniref:C-C motif chemokine ligand 14 n=1 Tax=Rousettus aegyptiacus TaxID=9407 RepID=A0A7J8G6W7_ROUAE|nr:C-C motif chemokine ligand 14 [Rousettus aegyptiacus]
MGSYTQASTLNCISISRIVLKLPEPQEAPCKTTNPCQQLYGEMRKLRRESSQQSQGGPYHPTECCFIYITRTVLRERITNYYKTSSQCSKPGVVFITKKGHSICANPSDDWVQDYIKELEI